MRTEVSTNSRFGLFMGNMILEGGAKEFRRNQDRPLEIEQPKLFPERISPYGLRDPHHRKRSPDFSRPTVLCACTDGHSPRAGIM